jgi:hypothetical protein
MSTCSDCGAELSNGARFCSRCGTRTAGETAEITSAVASSEEAPNTDLQPAHAVENETPRAKATARGHRLGLNSLDDATLKKLVGRSKLLMFLGVMFAGGAVINASVLLAHGSSPLDAVFILSVVAFQAAVAWGMLVRPAWGRPVGLVLCTLLLLKVPVGTLLGGFGLAALLKAPELFGPGQIDHFDLKVEMERRKQGTVHVTHDSNADGTPSPSDER